MRRTPGTLQHFAGRDDPRLSERSAASPQDACSRHRSEAFLCVMDRHDQENRALRGSLLHLIVLAGLEKALPTLQMPAADDDAINQRHRKDSQYTTTEIQKCKQSLLRREKCYLAGRYPSSQRHLLTHKDTFSHTNVAID